MRPIFNKFIIISSLPLLSLSHITKTAELYVKIYSNSFWFRAKDSDSIWKPLCKVRIRAMGTTKLLRHVDLRYTIALFGMGSGVWFEKTSRNAPIEIYNNNIMSDCKLIIKYVRIEARSEEADYSFQQPSSNRCASPTFQLVLREYLWQEERWESARDSCEERGSQISRPERTSKVPQAVSGIGRREWRSWHQAENQRARSHRW